MINATGRSRSDTGEGERGLTQTERNAVWSFFGGFILLGLAIIQLWYHPDVLAIAVTAFFSGAFLSASAFLIIIAKYRSMIARAGTRRWRKVI